MNTLIVSGAPWSYSSEFRFTVVAGLGRACDPNHRDAHAQAPPPTGRGQFRVAVATSSDAGHCQKTVAKTANLLAAAAATPRGRSACDWRRATSDEHPDHFWSTHRFHCRQLSLDDYPRGETIPLRTAANKSEVVARQASRGGTCKHCDD
jgi:hypothetical protein